MISDTTTSARYIVINGVLGYSIPFRIYTEADVAVFWSADARTDTKLTLGIHYTVTILTEGGTVNLLPGVVPVGATLAVVSNIPATQEAGFSSTSTVNTEALERQLDRQVQMVQQLGDSVARAVILPATSSETPQDVVQAVYAARDDTTAAASSAAGSQFTAAASAGAAAESAAMAAQTVEAATATAVSAAAAQANAAAASASAAAQSAMDAAAAVPENLVGRVADVEVKTRPATTTARGIGRVATLADMAPDATISNGPAFLSAGGGVVTPTPTANAVPQADADGKMAGGWLNPDENKANKSLDNVTNNAIGMYFYARDEKPSGTNGGSSTANTWMTRDLNTVKRNFIPGASLSNNRVTLPAGRYYVRARIPVAMTERTRAYLYNRTNGSYLLTSNSAWAQYDHYEQPQLILDDEITLTETSQLELSMYCSRTYANGCGFASSIGDFEIYSELHIWKM